MPILTAALHRFRKSAVTVAYRTETGLRDRLARDGEHDPKIYSDLAESHPDRVAAIALRQVRPAATTGAEKAASVNGVAILRGTDGDELLPLLHEALGAHPHTDR